MASLPTGILYSEPRVKPTSTQGLFQPGCYLFFYLNQTTTATNVYADAELVTPLSQPVFAAADGRFPPIYLNPETIYRVQLYNSIGVLLEDTPYVVPNTNSSTLFALLGLAQTAAENAAGIIPTNLAYEPLNVLRYGIVPNSPNAATTNTTALTTLLNPANIGPTGRLVFPNTTGTDIYYFNNMIQVRDGIRIDLGGCTLNFSKIYAVSDNTMGFFTFIRDVTIENGSIVVNYNGSTGAGNNPGPIMRIGSRSGYKFAGYSAGIFDQDDLVGNGLPPMGNITLRNLRMTTTNPNAAVGVMVLMLGGLRNVLVENIVLTGNGNSGPETGFYYEFGYSSTNGFPSTSQQWSSSHATNLVFRNITGKNFHTTSPQEAYVVALVEAYNATIENIHSEACGGTFEFRIGEAHFFRPWTADVPGVKRCITVRNITSSGATATAINLNGASDVTSSYLSDTLMAAAGLPVLTPSQKVDLMRFSLDGFSVDNQVSVSGPIDMRNGTVRGGNNPILLQAECQRFHLLNIEALNGSGNGIRANDVSTIFARNRIGTIRNCRVAGNIGAGIALANTASVLIEECQLGYNALYDPANETTQTDGILVDGTGTNAGGVYCKGNFVTVSGAGVGYHLIGGTSTICCGIEQARGIITTTGSWDIDGVAQANAATILDKSSFINNFTGAAGVTNKYLGRRCYDTTNTRLMIAQGTGATSNWVRADGGATVTPA